MEQRYSTVEDDEGRGKFMVLRGKWDPGLSRILSKGRYFGLRLSESAGWQEDHIDFVKGLDLRGLEVYSSRVRDVSPINSLGKLTLLGIDCYSVRRIVLPDVVGLKSCHLLWRSGADELLDRNRLERIDLASWPHASLLRIAVQNRLEDFSLHDSRVVESTKGLESLSRLRNLTVANCPKFQLASVLPKNLRRLDLFGCRRVENLGSVARLRLLEEFYMENCGEIESLKPLTACRQLRRLAFVNCRVQDGDLSPLLELTNLEEVFFANARHYSHSREEIEEHIRQLSRTPPRPRRP